jgi:hypothetical protein
MIETPLPPDIESEKFNRAIDVVHANAVGVARLCGAGSAEIPRLCVAAACRTVERLTSKEDGYPVARAAATDLQAALHEALNKTEALIRFIDDPDAHPGG